MFERYRAALAIDPGDCCGVYECLEPRLVEEAELIGVRAIDGAPSFQRPGQLDAPNRVESTHEVRAGLGR